MSDIDQRGAATAAHEHGHEHAASDETVGIVGPETRTPFHRGAPAAVGVPLFMVGSIALGLNLINFAPSADVGAPIALTLMAAGLFQLVTALWCVALGESIVASVFAIFAGFWLSYSALVFGLLHNWYGLTPAANASKAVVAADASAESHTIEAFLICWLVVVVMLTLATLRLPLTFSVLFILVDAALACVLVGTIQTSQNWKTAGGICIFAFVACGMLIYFDTMSQAFEGKPVPLGKPIMR